MQFPDARDCFFTHIYNQEERSLAKDGNLSQFPRESKDGCKLVHKEVSEFKIITILVSYLTTRPLTNSSGRMRRARSESAHQFCERMRFDLYSDYIFSVKSGNSFVLTLCVRSFH